MELFMAGIFYSLGKMLGPNVRKGKWIWNSLTADNDDAILSEHEVGLDIVQTLKTSLTLSQDRELKRFVARCGGKLAARVANKKIRFAFFVYCDNSPNAFAAPGGFIFVSSALLSLYDNDSDMTAFVVAHEMGHVVRRHAVNRLINAAAVSAATKFLPAQGKLAAMLKNTGVKFFQSAYSRSQELEADTFGVKLMKAGGYDCKKAIDALEKLAQFQNEKGATATNEYFSSHPQTAERIETIRQLIINNG